MLPNIFKHAETFFNEDIFDSSILYSPRTEVKKVEEGGWKISMALLGFKKEDLSIEAKNSVLTISGEITEDVPGFVTQKKFKKSWELKNLDSDNVNAKLENGILEVTLTTIKTEEENTKTIEIK